jgi:hypothetical protein
MLSRSIALLSLTTLLAVPLYAQQYRAQLRGTVLDPAGAPAGGIALRIVSESTGESRGFSSDDNGHYTITGLLPGTYRIESADARYPTFAARTDLSVNQETQVVLRLGIVPISVSSDLRPSAVPLDHYSPALTTRINPALITGLPLDGRNYLDLALLAPGLTPGPFGLAANGTYDPFTAYLLDGIYDTEPLVGTPAVRPQLDAIGEFEVRTSAYDVSFGRAAGAQVNVVTKSGTNRPAGGAFGFIHSDADRSQLGGFAGGPLIEDQTFLFGNYQHSQADGLLGDGSGHLLGGRLDQILAGASRLTARYGLDDDDVSGRRGQNFGLSFHHVPATSVTNEVRFGLSRVTFGGLADVPVAETQSYQLANTAMWSRGAHLVAAGLEWYGLRRGLRNGESAGSLGIFVQDNWLALPSVSISAGLRYDRAGQDERMGADDNSISPRFGAAWTVDRSGQTLVRGGYGIHHDHGAIRLVTPRVDNWSLGVQRQIGYARTFEAAYVATRGRDLLTGISSSRYDAMQLKLDQRSEAGNTALVAYTYGKWTEELGDDAAATRSPLDSRHRLSAAFIAVLPFGVDRRWLSEGVAATILGEMELSGIYTLQTGQPVFPSRDQQTPTGRTLDLALAKRVALGIGRSLQVRFETFNLSNHENSRRGRRYQFGGRFLF